MRARLTVLWLLAACSTNGGQTSSDAAVTGSSDAAAGTAGMRAQGGQAGSLISFGGMGGAMNTAGARDGGAAGSAGGSAGSTAGVGGSLGGAPGPDGGTPLAGMSGGGAGGMPVAGAAGSPACSVPMDGVSACNPQVKSTALLPAIHIAPDKYNPADYNSNPPSSGPHCDVWGNYVTFTAPLPRCNWIHNLEHGAVVLLHNCPDGCPDITGALGTLVRCSADSICSKPRLLVTPDPLLATKVAAAAWGWTFTADCLDGPALAALYRFTADHYGRGPETVCQGGGLGP